MHIVRKEGRLGSWEWPRSFWIMGTIRSSNVRAFARHCSPSLRRSKSVDRRWRSEKIEGFKKFEIKKKFMKHKTRKLGNIIDIYKFRISFQFSNSVGPWLNFGRKINSKIYCTFLNRENRGTTIFKQIILAFQFLEIHTQLNFERQPVRLGLDHLSRSARSYASCHPSCPWSSIVFRLLAIDKRRLRQFTKTIPPSSLLPSLFKCRINLLSFQQSSLIINETHARELVVRN